MPPFSSVDPMPPFTNGHRALENPYRPFSFFDPVPLFTKSHCAPLSGKAYCLSSALFWNA
ncbi:phosphoribosylaminoimidazolecarboxamide formyltransferase/IMP, partial [Sesbania bispinosa]